MQRMCYVFGGKANYERVTCIQKGKWLWSVEVGEAIEGGSSPNTVSQRPMDHKVKNITQIRWLILDIRDISLALRQPISLQN